MPGSDWMAESPDGFSRPDVRVALQTDDGEMILMHYTGLVERTEAFIAAADQDRPSGWDDQLHALRGDLRHRRRSLSLAQREALSSPAVTSSGPTNSSTRYTA